MKNIKSIFLFVSIFLALFTGCQKKEELPELNVLPVEAESELSSDAETSSSERFTEKQEEKQEEKREEKEEATPQSNNYLYSKEDIAEYIHTYKTLPENFITKAEARKLGWDSSKGNLWQVAPGFCIGGDKFSNLEGRLPKGRYFECDVDYKGGRRNEKRIVYTKDGDVYYTGDHYNSFEKLY